MTEPTIQPPINNQENGDEKDTLNEKNDSDVYDEIEIEDMDYDEEKEIYTYLCPCSGTFSISKADLKLGNDIGRCDL